MTLSDLVQAGFEKSATWRLGADDRPHLAGKMPTEPGVYLFVDQELVRYVGVTSGTLQLRMRPYERRLRQAISGRPVYKGIEDVLRAGREVEVYTLSNINPRIGLWGRLPLDYLVGIESGLIEQLNPAWNSSNVIGRAKRASAATQSE